MCRCPVRPAVLTSTTAMIVPSQAELYTVLGVVIGCDCTLRDQITRVKGGFDSPIILVGNKYDLAVERNVTMHEGEDFAHEWGIPFFETSAKTGHNVQEMFLEIVRQIDQKMPSNKSHHCCIVIENMTL